MANEYGLDTHYFKKNLEMILRDIDRYTPAEMERALRRLAGIAKRTMRAESIFNYKFNTQ